MTGRARGLGGWLALAVVVGLGWVPVQAVPFAYITNVSANTVSVMATATNQVVGAPIPVGAQPVAFGLFIGPRAPEVTPIPVLSPLGHALVVVVVGVSGLLVLRRRLAIVR